MRCLPRLTPVTYINKQTNTHAQLAAKGATEFDPSWVVDQALQVDEAGKAQVFYTFQQPLLPLGQQLPGDYYLKVRGGERAWHRGRGGGGVGAHGTDRVAGRVVVEMEDRREAAAWRRHVGGGGG